MNCTHVGIAIALLTIATGGSAQASPVLPIAKSNGVVSANNDTLPFDGLGTREIGGCTPHGDSGEACGSASAAILGSSSFGGIGAVKASGSAKVTGAKEQHVLASNSAAAAHLSYFLSYTLNDNAPPDVPPMPLNVSYTLDGEGEVLGAGGYSTFASISVFGDTAGLSGAFSANKSGSGSVKGKRKMMLDFSETVTVQFGVVLDASGSVAVSDSRTFPNPRGSFNAVADPIFEIDTSYPFRDFFTLQYSPNLVSVPEPGTLVLMGATAAIALLGYRLCTQHDQPL
jgi:hypothetical protein